MPNHVCLLTKIPTKISGRQIAPPMKAIRRGALGAIIASVPRLPTARRTLGSRYMRRSRGGRKHPARRSMLRGHHTRRPRRLLRRTPRRPRRLLLRRPRRLQPRRSRRLRATVAATTTAPTTAPTATATLASTTATAPPTISTHHHDFAITSMARPSTTSPPPSAPAPGTARTARVSEQRRRCRAIVPA